MVVPGLSKWHDAHESAARALQDVKALPAHALLESYSVLTRLRSGLALTGQDAALLLGRFEATPVLQLGGEARRRLVATLASAGVHGGAVYDGLVGLEAREHGELLLTRDRRARTTYERLGVEFEMIAA